MLTKVFGPKILILGAMWAGLVFLAASADGFLFPIELNLAQGDFLTRYTTAAQYNIFVLLVIVALLVALGLRISIRLLHINSKRMFLSVLFGVSITTLSLFNLNHILEFGYEAYLQGFPLPWLENINGMGTFNNWILVIRSPFVILDILFWAGIAQFAIFARTKFPRRLHLFKTVKTERRLGTSQRNKTLARAINDQKRAALRGPRR